VRVAEMKHKHFRHKLFLFDLAASPTAQSQAYTKWISRSCNGFLISRFHPSMTRILTINTRLLAAS
jgi:hypothetical protein